MSWVVSVQNETFAFQCRETLHLSLSLSFSAIPTCHHASACGMCVTITRREWERRGEERRTFHSGGGPFITDRPNDAPVVKRVRTRSHTLRDATFYLRAKPRKYMDGIWPPACVRFSSWLHLVARETWEHGHASERLFVFLISPHIKRWSAPSPDVSEEQQRKKMHPQGYGTV